MKAKSNTIPHLTLNFLSKIAIKLPKDLSVRKSEEMLQMAKKYQIRLGRTKRIMCDNCHLILIPKVNSQMIMEKNERGFGLNVKCLNCETSKFIVKKLKN